jgi:hypothetical protein
MRKHHLQLGASGSQEQEQTGEECGQVEGYVQRAKSPACLAICRFAGSVLPGLI